MTTKHVKIRLDFLKAANLITSTEEARYYLNGVCLQAGADGAVTYTATDGHRMFVARSTSETGKTAFVGELIIPSTIIAPLKLDKQRPDQLYVLSVDTRDCTLQLGNNQSLGFKAIDASYPDWRRVMPGALTGETAQFNPSAVESFRKAGDMLGVGKLPHIQHNGTGPAVVRWVSEEFFGILMPSRNGKPATILPAWASVGQKAA